MLHEMVHQWQAETGLPVDHGPLFREKAGRWASWRERSERLRPPEVPVEEVRQARVDDHG